MDQLSRELAETALDGAYGQLSEVAAGLDAAGLLRPSRCAGWAAGDVLYHQLLDARRALRTFARPGTTQPDRDDISYWRSYSSGGDVAPGTETADAACRAARACPYDLVTTQGLVLRTTDFIGTLAVEAAVHYLDLVVGLPAAPPADPIPLRLVRRVLDGLLGAPLAIGWDDETYALKDTGRLALTDAECSGLGPAVDRFPLFG
jgi:Mycothiol maleylpyruvate isomerase N-terminal domain